MEDTKKLKIVIVGDGAVLKNAFTKEKLTINMKKTKIFQVGKTCLCLVFAGKEVKWDSYEPTIFENHAVDFKVGNQVY